MKMVTGDHFTLTITIIINFGGAAGGVYGLPDFIQYFFLAA